MKQPMRTGAVLVALVLMYTASAAAQQWNERTTLTFSTPVMVPGATLPAGTYEFALADIRSNRHLVRITNSESGETATLTQAVPLRREEPSEDIVLQFNPTAAGSPPAIKAWFYPGSGYGHEFVYSEEEARDIANRTKEVVLAVDVPGSDLEKGQLRLYPASGAPTDWLPDAVTSREWQEWQRSRQASSQQEVEQSTAAAIRGDFEGMRVTLDELEDQPRKYTGQRISVDGEIEEVYGPRLFTIDEPNWGDLDGEILVLLPSPLAALVKDDDRVTITGTIRPFLRADFEREWGWFDLSPELEAEISSKPVLVAERLVGGTDNVAMIIDTTPAAPRPVGTSGGAVTDTSTLSMAEIDAVGRQANLTGARVTAAADDGGFFIAAGDRHIFVLPAASATSVSAGDMVTIDGVVLRMPRRIGDELKAPGAFNEEVYIYAREVAKG